MSKEETKTPDNDLKFPNPGDLAELGAGILAATPAFSMGVTYVASAMSLARMFGNADTAQHCLNILSADATAAETELLLHGKKRGHKKKSKDRRRERLVELLHQVLVEDEDEELDD